MQICLSMYDLLVDTRRETDKDSRHTYGMGTC